MMTVSAFHPLSSRMKNTLVPIVLFVSILIAGLSVLYKDIPPQMSLETSKEFRIPAPNAGDGQQTELVIFE